MDYRDRKAKTVEKELAKDRGIHRCVIRLDTGEGELHVDGETLRVPAYSFTEMSDIVRNEFEKRNPVRKIVPSLVGLTGSRQSKSPSATKSESRK